MPAHRRSNRIAIGLSLLAAAFCAAALPAQPWSGRAAFELRVDDGKGHPVEGAIVALAHLDPFAAGGPAPLVTDATGRLAIGGLAAGSWQIEVRKPGFLTFRAEIVVAFDTKPEIVTAAQHNVAGARATLRVRLRKLRDAPAAKPQVMRAEPPPPAPAPPVEREPAAAPPAAPPAETPAETPAQPTSPPAPEPPATEPERPSAPPAPEPEPPTPEREPAVEPSPEPSPESETPIEPAAPEPPSEPAADEPAAEPEPEPVPAPEPQPVPPAAPAEEAPPVPPAPAVAPPSRSSPPVERTCFECRPGESAIFTDAALAAGGACPASLGARLAAAPFEQIPELIGSLPAGCVVLRIDLPRTSRYTGFRYEVSEPGAARPLDCFPRQACPGGSGRFPLEPVIRREESSTVALAIFEATAPRTAGFTVYWAKAR